MFYIIEVVIGVCIMAIVISGTIGKVIKNIKKGFKD